MREINREKCFLFFYIVRTLVKTYASLFPITKDVRLLLAIMCIIYREKKICFAVGKKKKEGIK